MKADRRDTHRLRNLIAVLSMLFGFMSASVWIINRPVVLERVLSVINVKSDWNISLGRLIVHPSSMSVTMERLVFAHKTEPKGFSADLVKIGIKPVGLIRGKLVIDDFDVELAKIDIPKPFPKKDKKSKKLDLAKLILLKNLEIEEGRIGQTLINFGGTKIAADQIRLSINTRLFRSTSISIKGDGLVMSDEDGIIASIGTANIVTASSLSKLNENFPYLNMFSGTLKAGGIVYEGLGVESIDASMLLKNDDISLNDLKITVEGRCLEGRASANLATENFSVMIDIEKPISLPYLGRSNAVVDTKGDLSGKASFTGRGFSPFKSSGNVEFYLKYKFAVADDHPAALSGKASWQNGVVSINDMYVQIDQDKVAISGSLDVSGRKMNFKGKTLQFPAQYVMEIFKNPHLNKIFGRTDAELDFSGWGKDFILKINGVTYNGGWNDLIAEHAVTDLKITYNGISLDGFITSGTKKTGEASLKVDYGPKIKGKPERDKNIELSASMTNHPLEVSLKQYSVTGIGNGSIELSGNLMNYKGFAKAEITSGSIKGVEFEKARSEMHISKNKVAFRNLFVSLFKKSPDMSGEIIADIGHDKTRFAGKPSPEINVDVTYLKASKSWTVKDLSWQEGDDKLSMTGKIVSQGKVDLRIDGSADVSLVRPFLKTIRSGSGKVDIGLDVRGPSEDLRLHGKMKFNKNDLAIREIQLILENLEGSLIFEGQRIKFHEISASSEDGSLKLSGWIDHRKNRPSAVEALLSGTAMHYRSYDQTFNMDFEGDLSLKGSFPSPLLSGRMLILDGRYTKDFNLLDALISEPKKKGIATTGAKTGAAEVFNPRLDLNVKSNGDMEIRNNVGRIWLRINTDVRGTWEKPTIAGSINTEDGIVDYLGLKFDITKGFVELREKYSEPYLEVHAEKELGVHNINLVLYGPIDNLALDLSATSPSGLLEKRDVVSLILFGITEQERQLAANQGGSDQTSALISSSISGLMERPITQFTGLDLFRLEASETDSRGGSKPFSRLYIGKDISDRLSVKFSTDIDSNESIQTIIAEYLLTDHFLVRGARSTDFSSEISGIVRFRLR